MVTILGMSSPHSEDPGNGSSNTLGSVLYADGAEAVPETEWTALVVAISNRNERALRELYERTHRIVFTLIVRIVRDPLTAEEVLVDVYHDVWRKATTFDAARGTVIAWLMNQTRSRAIDRFRAMHRQKRTGSDVLPALVEPVLFEPATVAVQRNALERCLAMLTPEERRAIETAYFDELTYAEVARRLGEPLGTIKTRIRTGLAKLRTLVAEKDMA